MWLWAGDFRAVFWVAVVPGLLAVLLLVLVLGVREPTPHSQAVRSNPIHMDSLRRLGQRAAGGGCGRGLLGCAHGHEPGPAGQHGGRCAPADLRGSAFGFFNLACGVAMLLASVCAGALWDGVGPAATFYAGAGFAALTGVMLWRTAKN